jgi:acyl-CoA reductase-like NAD-dependent aldehyde dehydrogenase
MAGILDRPLTSFVNGEAVSDGATRLDINPSRIDETVAQFYTTTPRTVDDAVEAAHSAFAGWRSSPAQLRSDILYRAAAEIDARKHELGTLLAREEGKTLPEAEAEVGRAAQIFRFFAGEPLRAGGERLPSARAGIIVDIIREPVGVVGLITPWNFPIAIPAWKIAPALAYGNCVIFKPAELVPATACALVDIVQRAGLPPGVLNLVLGSGREVGQALVSHHRVNALSFTGSQEVGHGIARELVARMGRVQLEMGGKNPLVVAADADLDVAVEVAVQGAFFSTGQRCTASSRLIVEARVHDQFVEKLLARTAELVVGDALAPGTEIGPVVDERQLTSNQDHLRSARQLTGVEVVGGERLDTEQAGYYMRPALVLGGSNDDPINTDEVFGPIAGVIKVSDYDEALTVANDTEFGLCSGICTTSLRTAEHFKAHSAAGMVMVNLPTAGVDYHVPFGGRKASSYGPREQGTYAREFFTMTKTAYVGGL